MIPDHALFLEAIPEKRKLWVRLYSTADGGVVNRVCAPMDYGPAAGQSDGVNRYWVWDYESRTGTHTLGLLPQEIVDLQILGEVFDPAEFNPMPAQWFTPRDWARRNDGLTG